MHTVGILERWIIVLALLPPFVWCWVGWDGIIMELYKVPELWWGLDSMNDGLLHCSFFWSVFWNLCVLATQLFHSTHCPGGLGSSLVFFLVSSKENSLWVISGWGCSLWSSSTWGRCDLVQCTREAIRGETKMKRIWHLLCVSKWGLGISTAVAGTE